MALRKLLAMSWKIPMLRENCEKLSPSLPVCPRASLGAFLQKPADPVERGFL